MRNRSDILPSWERFLSVFFFISLMRCVHFVHCQPSVSDSYKQNGKSKAANHHLKIEKVATDKAAVADDPKDLCFPVILTKGYMVGKIDDLSYVIYTENVNNDEVNGKYYLIDYQKSTFTPQPFQLLREQNGKFRLITPNINSHVTFTLSDDSVSLSGILTFAAIPDDKHRVTFQRYTEPELVGQNSTLYQEPRFSFHQISDLSYGKAKGYYTSYPTEDESHFGRLFLNVLPKTAKKEEQDLLLDLYLPEDENTTKHPLMVLFHGGAFFFGDKGTLKMRQWCEHFARLGYVVASVNYRLGFKISKKSIQQCGYQTIQDAHAALRFLVANADKYHIDPNFIFLAGTSSGSITAMGTAFMNDENCPPFVAKNKFAEKCGLLHSSGNDFRNEVKIKAIANMWGAIYDLHELDGTNIPMVSFHGTEDKIVPFNQGFPFSGLKSDIGKKMFDKMYGSQAIHEYLDSLHVRNILYPLEGCGHAPFQEKDGTLNEHYLFIQEKMQQFFYSELIPHCSLKPDEHNPQLYRVENKDFTKIIWQAEGGIILETHDDWARVIWFADAPKHLLRVSIINTIGIPNQQEWDLLTY